MKLTPSEYQHVLQFFGQSPMTPLFNAGHRLAFKGLAGKGCELGTLDEDTLRRLIAFLPHGKLKKVHSPVLSKVQKKARQTLVHLARPHLNPDFWPKVFRNLNNNDRKGLRDFGGGQLGVLHDRAMATPLRGRFVWNERKFGDLLVMGPWSAISSTLADGSSVSFEFGYEDIYAGDVNMEWDRMYREEEIPKDDRGFYVTYLGGCAFEVADEEGEVVLDPRGELVNLAGGAVAGFAGAGVALDGALEVIGVVKDAIGTSISMGDNMGVKLKGSSGNRNMHTFIVSILPSDKNTSVATGKQSMTGKEFLDICRTFVDAS
jgi:hypothetical protein